jgi:hypothetical protein
MAHRMTAAYVVYLERAIRDLGHANRESPSTPTTGWSRPNLVQIWRSINLKTA